MKTKSWTEIVKSAVSRSQADWNSCLTKTWVKSIGSCQLFNSAWEITSRYDWELLDSDPVFTKMTS